MAHKGNQRHQHRDNHRPEVRIGSVPPGPRVMGRNCITEVVRHQANRVVVVYAANKEIEKEDERQKLLDLIRTKSIKIEFVDKEVITQLVESDSHQGFAAVLKDRHHPELKEFLKAAEAKERSLVLMLDSIYDPQNLGAILRAAECFSADAVVWSKNRGASITPATTKVSVGASELVPTILVSNLVETARRFKESGYWIATAEVGEGTQDLTKFEFPEKVLLVLGSEDEGIQRLLSELSDFRVKIPILGKIDSLNVSQAAAILLFAAQKISSAR